MAAKNSTTAYVNKLKELYAHELEYIGSLAEMTFASGEAMKESAKDAVKEIEDTVSRLMVDVPDATPSVREPIPFPGGGEGESANELEPAGEDFGEQESDDTLVFDRLQFGRDYDFDQEPGKL